MKTQMLHVNGNRNVTCEWKHKCYVSTETQMLHVNGNTNVMCEWKHKCYM